MVFGNGFFTYTENEALEEMTKAAGCLVLPCVFPTASKIAYYLSEKGDIYSVQLVQGKFLTRTKSVENGSHSKRKNGGLIVRLKSTPKTERSFHLEWLMYCTFILKRWQERQQQLVFLDGNARNVRPDNLRLPSKRIPPEWSEHMDRHQALYESEFSTIVRMTAQWSGLPEEDAKDIVQSVFIAHTTESYSIDFNGKLWFFWCKRRALDYLNNRYRRFVHGEFIEDVYEGGADTHCEVNLYDIRPGQRSRKGKKGNLAGYYLYLWAHGCTPTQIAETSGSKIGTVASSITHRLQYLKQQLKNEENLLR